MIKVYFIKKDYFNYVPIKCPYLTHTTADDFCPFAHNKYEIDYHPLIFKTLICKKTTCLVKSEKYLFFCPQGHQNDLRHVYNSKNPIIIKLIQICLKENLFTFNKYSCQRELEFLFASQVLCSEFNPSTYKTKACPLGEFCRLDPKLCLNYHNDKERRRDPNRNYDNKNCPEIFLNKLYSDPKSCSKVK
jgi:hypothetical protein